MTITLRAPIADDATAAGQICYDAFKSISERHNFPPDFPAPEVARGLFEHMLSRSDIHGVIAERNGRVVGSNFLWESQHVAGVGPITVAPSEQDKSVGRRLMEAVLTRAREKGIAAVRLVQAAYHARSLSLYTKLGFVSREPLALLQGPALRGQFSGYVTRPAVQADLSVMDEVCRRVHGHDRSSDAAGAIAQGVARVVEHDRCIVGYTTGVGFFGHTVGLNEVAVKALIASAPEFSGPGFLLPIRQAALFQWCLAQRLKVIQPMTLMSIGPYSEPQGSFLPSILY